MDEKGEHLIFLNDEKKLAFNIKTKPTLFSIYISNQ